MAALRTAVIGTGYLGRFHAEKYARHPDCELVAVADVDAAAAREVGQRWGCEALEDYRELLGAVDALSIVVPTTLHHAIARDCLRRGIHVLIEKPITTTVPEADELIALARERGAILQVGHLERFNAALVNLDRVLDRPLFIESTRLAPFRPRATDVSVVLDLMIHDIDIILDVVGAEVRAVEANGITVLTDEIDIANARLVFDNGCIANVTASRISMKSERKMRFFQHNAYVSCDFQNRILSVYQKGDGEQHPGVPEILAEERAFEANDALRDEIAHFVQCVRDGRRPLVDGVAGRRALALATRITELVNQSTVRRAFAESSAR